MKRHFSLEIPTKKYLKAFIISQLGARPVITAEHVYGNVLFDLLQREPDEKGQLINARYETCVTVFISHRIYYRRGVFLSHGNIKRLNNYIEEDLKTKFHFLMDFYNNNVQGFEMHLQKVRDRLGVDMEAWSDDSMKKEYYRYRKSEGKPLFYVK